MEIVLVVAVAENGVIGSGNAIPWRLKSDMPFALKQIALCSQVSDNSVDFIVRYPSTNSSLRYPCAYNSAVRSP